MSVKTKTRSPMRLPTGAPEVTLDPISARMEPIEVTAPGRPSEAHARALIAEAEVRRLQAEVDRLRGRRDGYKVLSLELQEKLDAAQAEIDMLAQSNAQLAEDARAAREVAADYAERCEELRTKSCKSD